MFRFPQRLGIFMMCIFFSVSFFSSGWCFSSSAAESGGRGEFSCGSPWRGGGSRGRARSELQTQVVMSYDGRKPSTMLALICPTELEARVEHLLCELPGGEGGGAGGGGVAAGPGAGAGPPTLLLHLIGPPRDARLCIILLLDAIHRSSQTFKSFSYFPPFPSALLKVWFSWILFSLPQLWSAFFSFHPLSPRIFNDL